ncbi:E3 ubiquitin-protein ligase RNF180-like [Ctenocephalides felis]|uniref:E3 ubiquitin-protein ligase RNF180-like n=1 Tax=Ctenocephalides felis TaxID=7515 RepID=UPI000E6E3F47|nr:E3 ubiquitin-protein ligase RNF180-like [Ctenocephalides felis]
MKCRKCRAVLYENEFVFDGHGAKINKNSESNCKTALDRFCFHEENLPSWMLSAIETSQWTKGKINCPKCGIKIGSFDFVSGNKCECAEYVIPPIYVIKSKTDILLK